MQEGESTYDMPYAMDYVVDVAVQKSTDSDWGYYSAIVDTGSANLGTLISLFAFSFLPLLIVCLNPILDILHLSITRYDCI